MAGGQAISILKQSLRDEDADLWRLYRESEGTGVDLSEADLMGALLQGYDLGGVNLSGACLKRANLSGADLTGACLAGADMERCNLAKTRLAEADLSEALLKGANLVDTDLRRARMKGARLEGAWFLRARLGNTDLSGARLRGARFKESVSPGLRLEGADVEEADLAGLQLDRAVINTLVNYETALPPVFSKSVASAYSAPPTVEEEYEHLFTEEDSARILGVAPDAEVEEITRAWRQRVKEYHPDRVVNLGEKIRYVAQREFVRIQHAYRSMIAHQASPTERLMTSNGATPDRDPERWGIEEYRQLVERYPENDVYHYNLGVRYLEAGSHEEAVRAFTRAVELNPNNQDARYNLKLAKVLLAL